MDENEKEKLKVKSASSGKAIDPMAYEMELNRIDFRNDVSSILDQIEKEFEINSVANMGSSLTSNVGHIDLASLHLETPPDSDSENNTHNMMMTNSIDLQTSSLAETTTLLARRQTNNVQENASPRDVNNQVLAFDRLTKKIRLNELEDLELVNTSRSEIDQLLGEDQLCMPDMNSSNRNIPERPETLENVAIAAKTRQKLLTISQLKPSKRSSSILPNSSEHTKQKVGIDKIKGGNKIAINGIPSIIGKTQKIQEFAPKSVLLSSSLKSAKRKLLQCQLCPSTFSELTELKSHLELNHNTTSKSSPANTKVGKKERSTANKNFTCSLCEKGFVQKSHLTRHMKIHGIDKKNGSTEIPRIANKVTSILQEQFICRICQKNCKNKVCFIFLVSNNF